MAGGWGEKAVFVPSCWCRTEPVSAIWEFYWMHISGHTNLWPPLCFPFTHSTFASVFICAFPSVNLCWLSLAFATFCFLLLTLLTILGGDKQLNNINNNLLGTLINEFSLWPSCNHSCAQCKPADWGALTNSGAVFRLSSLWILVLQKTKEHKNLRNYKSFVDFIGVVNI